MALKLTRSLHEHAHEPERLYSKSRGNSRRKIRSSLNSVVVRRLLLTGDGAMHRGYLLSNTFGPLEGLPNATEDARIFTHNYCDGASQ
jgi:hypothetical protein